MSKLKNVPVVAIFVDNSYKKQKKNKLRIYHGSRKEGITLNVSGKQNFHHKMTNLDSIFQIWKRRKNMWWVKANFVGSSRRIRSKRTKSLGFITGKTLFRYHKNYCCKS